MDRPYPASRCSCRAFPSLHHCFENNLPGRADHVCEIIKNLVFTSLELLSRHLSFGLRLRRHDHCSAFLDHADSIGIELFECLRVCPKTSGGITKFSEHE